MVVRKSINQTDLWAIKNHLESTAWEMIKWYTLAQLSLMDWRDTRTIRNSWDYLPVRVDNNNSFFCYRKWLQAKPYKTLYVRMDEIKQIFTKRNKGKRLITE